MSGQKEMSLITEIFSYHLLLSWLEMLCYGLLLALFHL